MSSAGTPHDTLLSSDAAVDDRDVLEQPVSNAGDNSLDHATVLLVRLAAQLAGGAEADVRVALQTAVPDVNPEWVEEVILQTYLFAGFPRARNGAREWRRISGRTAPLTDDSETFDGALWRQRGAVACETVYGRFYKQLRANIRVLHPALDSWMIVEGYGTTDLARYNGLWARVQHS